MIIRFERLFVRHLFLILLGSGFVAEAFAQQSEMSDSYAETTETTKGAISTTKRDFPTDLEIAFLNCSLGCRSEVEKGSLFQCLAECQKTTRIPPSSIKNVMYLGVGNGVTVDECRKQLPDSYFVCPQFSTGCCCEGFFDCKRMETIVKGCTIKTCTTGTDGREICTCVVN